MSAPLNLQARPGLGRCGYCHQDLAEPAALSPACPTCGAQAHAGCRLELARCASCGEERVGLPAQAPPGWSPAAWGPDLAYFRPAHEPTPGPSPGRRLRLDLERPARAGGVLTVSARLVSSWVEQLEIRLQPPLWSLRQASRCCRWRLSPPPDSGVIWSLELRLPLPHGCETWRLRARATGPRASTRPLTASLLWRC